MDYKSIYEQWKQDLPQEILDYREPLNYEELIGDVTLNKLHEIFKDMMKRQEDKIDPVRSQFGKIEKDEVVGFIGLKKDLVESYMILDMMQVSASYRGRGIGRKLFDEGKKEARKAGAEALYISACSSEETIVFYKAMGAELTDCPIKEIAESEPYDLQMICSV